MEDDTAAIEMLAFSNVLSQYGGYIRENVPVVIIGKISLREDKEPQLIINRARPMSDYAHGTPADEPFEQPTNQHGTLYLRLPTEEGKLFFKIRSVLNMFPGDEPVVVYFEDTKARRGSRCALDKRMLAELVAVLGQENVVIK